MWLKPLNLNLFNFIVVLMSSLTKNILNSSITLSKGNCEYYLSNNQVYNLLPLRKGSDYTKKYKKYIYKANFCGPLVTNTCTPDLHVPAAVYLHSKILTLLSFR